jgi:hypothetical protein
MRGLGQHLASVLHAVAKADVRAAAAVGDRPMRLNPSRELSFVDDGLHDLTGLLQAFRVHVHQSNSAVFQGGA